MSTSLKDVIGAYGGAGEGAPAPTLVHGNLSSLAFSHLTLALFLGR